MGPWSLRVQGITQPRCTAPPLGCRSPPPAPPPHPTHPPTHPHAALLQVSPHEMYGAAPGGNSYPPVHFDTTSLCHTGALWRAEVGECRAVPSSAPPPALPPACLGATPPPVLTIPPLPHNLQARWLEPSPTPSTCATLSGWMPRPLSLLLELVARSTTKKCLTKCGWVGVGACVEGLSPASAFPRCRSARCCHVR